MAAGTRYSFLGSPNGEWNIHKFLEASEVATGFQNEQNSSRRILVVDDDLLIRKLLGRWLQDEGYQVIQAAGAEEALEAIRSSPPDILITDLEMPGMNGLELCRAVRALDLPHYLYVVVLTASTEEGSLIASLEAGADNFLTKPVTREELLARIRSSERILGLDAKLRKAALTDLLTGLLTRRAFLDQLYREWHRARREKTPLACAMIDIDFFKRINDVHGHTAGDVVLRTVADLLRQETRGSDVLARLGGEEFCALLPQCNESGAAKWAERVRESVARTPIAIGDRYVAVTVSVGVADSLEEESSAEQMLERADQALLCAKQAGRDRVVRYSTLVAESADDESLNQSTQDPFAGLAAADIMTPLVVTFSEKDSVAAAVETFTRLRTNSAPVVAPDGTLAGIVSEKDLMVAMGSLSNWFRSVGELMRQNVITFALTTPVRKIYEFLCRVTIRRVVVVDGPYPVGTISRGTLLRWFRNLAVAKGLLPPESAEATESATKQMHSRIGGILTNISQKLRQSGEKVQELVQNQPEDLVPHLVGLATALQSLVNDLLGCSRNLSSEDAESAEGPGPIISGIGGD
jgi:two-component system cell cycle response regulator